MNAMQFLLHIIAMIAMGLPNILGYNLIFGRGKIFHFGPIGVSLACAYTIFLTLLATQSYVLGILAGFLMALVISLLFTWLSLRLEPDALGLISIAMHLAFFSVVLNWSSVTRGALGIPRIPRMYFLNDLPSFTFVSVVLAALWFLFLWRIDRGAFGRQLHALAEHPWHASSLGIDRRRIHIVAFLIGGGGAVLTNILFPQYLFLLHPNDYTFANFIFFIMVIVAGKPGSVLGVTLSAILLSFLKEGLRFLPLPIDMIGPFRLLLFGVILLVAVRWRRETLFPPQRSV